MNSWHQSAGLRGLGEAKNPSNCRLFRRLNGSKRCSAAVWHSDNKFRPQLELLRHDFPHNQGHLASERQSSVSCPPSASPSIRGLSLPGCPKADIKYKGPQRKCCSPLNPRRSGPEPAPPLNWWCYPRCRSRTTSSSWRLEPGTSLARLKPGRAQARARQASAHASSWEQPSSAQPF